MNNLIDDTAQLVFSGGNPVINRIEKRAAEDESEESQVETDYTEELDGALDLSARLNMLFKTVDILGQILKGHYGVIRNDKKKEIITEIFNGPLRALKEFFGLVSVSKEALIVEIESLLEEKGKTNNAFEKSKAAQKALFNLVGMVTHGFLFRSSMAVGSDRLADVTRELIDEEGFLAYRLIYLGTIFDAQTAIPFGELRDVSKEVSGNILAQKILQNIVLRRLYLFKTSDADKQRLCEITGISMKDQRSIDLKSKPQKKLNYKR